MTKVWFVKEGPDPTRGGPAYNLPHDSCVSQLGLAKSQWLSGLNKAPRFGDQTSRVVGVAAYRYVVCEVDDSEAAEYDWKAGFYRLEIGPQEVGKRLGPWNSEAED
jgi:hypothetical protein